METLWKRHDKELCTPARSILASCGPQVTEDDQTGRTMDNKISLLSAGIPGLIKEIQSASDEKQLIIQKVTTLEADHDL